MDYRRPSDASNDSLKHDIKRTYLTEADIYKELWHGRDFEINSLWQRSIFLGTFLVLAYTGYGLLWSSLVKENFKATTVLLSNTLDSLLLNFGFIALCGFGLTISILWIQMAKGSKRWYERYENSISLIINEYDLENRVFSFPHQPQGKEGLPMHGYLEEADCDDSLFSPKAGKYSVSKINIAIGQIAFIIWRLLFVLHISLLLIQIFIEPFKELWRQRGWDLYVLAFLYGIIISVIGILPITRILTEGTRSGA